MPVTDRRGIPVIGGVGEADRILLGAAEGSAAVSSPQGTKGKGYHAGAVEGQQPAHWPRESEAGIPPHAPTEADGANQSAKLLRQHLGQATTISARAQWQATISGNLKRWSTVFLGSPFLLSFLVQ